MPSGDLAGARRATRLYRDLLSGLSTLPGVSAVGATRTLPGSVESNGAYWIDHLPKELNITAPDAVYSIVTPGAFAVLGVPLKRGRDFNSSDVYDAPFTAVISEALARNAFPHQDPLGHAIYCGMDSMKPMTIVGVVGDIRHGPAREPSPEVYMPYEQHPRPATALNLILRTSGDVGSLSAAIRSKVRERSAEVPVKFSRLEELLSENTAAPAVPGVATRYLRRHRGVFSHGRRLRCDGLRGEPARRRDQCAHGAWREPRRRAAADSPARHGADRRRDGARVDRFDCRHAPGRQYAVCGEAWRPHDLTRRWSCCWASCRWPLAIFRPGAPRGWIR